LYETTDLGAELWDKIELPLENNDEPLIEKIEK